MFCLSPKIMMRILMKSLIIFFRYFVQSSFMKPSETISLNDLLGSNGVIESQRIPADKKFFKWSGLKLIVEILKC